MDLYLTSFLFLGLGVGFTLTSGLLSLAVLYIRYSHIQLSVRRTLSLSVHSYNVVPFVDKDLWENIFITTYLGGFFFGDFLMDTYSSSEGLHSIVLIGS